jgi:hypothetical protein
LLLHRYRAPKEAKANRFKAAQTFFRSRDVVSTLALGQ